MIAELHFILPIDNMQPIQLSQALLSDPLIANDEHRRSWAEQIARWSFATLRGFLQGYIDLTICHDQRWHVVDYKTNQLVNYTQAACEDAMREHDYLLQGRLYCLPCTATSNSILPITAWRSTSAA